MGKNNKLNSLARSNHTMQLEEGWKNKNYVYGMREDG